MNINSFIHKKQYEKIVRVARRHPITFVKIIIFFILLLAIPFILFRLGEQLFPNLMHDEHLINDTIFFILFILAGCAYLLSVIIFFYAFFIDFYLDEMIITNDRMVDMEQNGLLARTVAEADLYLIQDVTSEIKGLFGSIFKYGKVSIQTAGAVPKFVIEDVPDPHGLRKLLLDLASEDKKFHAGQK